ncbi:TPA: ATP F0F1 synthase synthase [Yersinia enterocolitica]
MMNNIFAKVKGPRKKPFFKLVSDYTLFETLDTSAFSLIPYNPDHKLDDDSWFVIKEFSQQPFCLSCITADFDSKDYDDLTKRYFAKISYIFSSQDNDFYFQKVTPSLFIKRKTIAFGESAEIEENEGRLIINNIPDAVYFKGRDLLIFKNLATISSIFKGIDVLYKEATEEQVNTFLGESFIGLSTDYDIEKVSKPNRRRIALAMDTLAEMSAGDRNEMLLYINDYCAEKLKYDGEENKFEISSEEELKYLLYGIEQRFYTTRFGNEKRLANSILKL